MQVHHMCVHALCGCVTHTVRRLKELLGKGLKGPRSEKSLELTSTFLHYYLVVGNLQSEVEKPNTHRVGCNYRIKI